MPSEPDVLVLGLVPNISFLFLRCFKFFFLFRAALAAHGSSQARGLIGAIATGLCHSQIQCQIQAMSVTYIAAHGNARSLTYWARQGIEPTISWFLVGFYLFIYFCLFYGLTCDIWKFRARGLIRTVFTGLHHSPSNARSEPHLWPIPQITAMLDP